ncbi:M56 family metallopeptidase [Mucilaginibacter dorajii]|uniref:Peptidase M56 domain-containing protein n=1 Tax=Mucilaginibacter dorajii TaxID=692994 RepID=A0ABP7PSR2_9SPHI|nr:M56 family metallopeptidase [Mucilaginibacter dorajii]MCS3736879.1 beta-lactamase regulating signal transducer with metallopeptidase domain [Mucilaginibacter dorajii]
MGLFFIHIIKSSLCLVFFYMAYKALLSKETFYKVNRFILLSIIIASILLPFFEMSISQPAVAAVPVRLKGIEHLILQKQVHLTGFTADTGDGFYSLLFFIYLTGVLIQLIITAVNFTRIYRLARYSTKQAYEGYTLAITSQEQSPFSWGNYIVLSKNDYQNQPEIIIQHELIHLKRFHSCDLLLAELAIIIFWFNPTIWLLKKELKDIHEFEVDDTLIKQGVDAKEYQLLLIRKAVGEKLYSVANTFNQSSISKRIRMMLRKRSNPWAQLKYLCIIVLTLFSVIAFARPDVTNELKGISTAKLGGFIKKQVTAIAAAAKIEKRVAPVDKPVKADQMPMAKSTDVVPVVQDQNNQVDKSASSPLCMVNGKETSYAQFEMIAPEAIKSVKVLKEKEAIAVYGDKGKHGAIEITVSDITAADIFKQFNNPNLNNTTIAVADVIKILKQAGVVNLNNSGITAADVIKLFKQSAVLKASGSYVTATDVTTRQPDANGAFVINDTEATVKEPNYVFFIGGKIASPEQQLLLSANKELLFKNDSDTIESTISITGKAATDKYGAECKNGVVEVYLKGYNNIKK